MSSGVLGVHRRYGRYTNFDAGIGYGRSPYQVIG